MLLGDGDDDNEDEKWIRRALVLAAEAAEHGEIPVAALVVGPKGLIAEASNSVEELQDPTAHAEVLAIRKAVDIIGEKRLLGATLYVTLEPCAMCAGAIVLSRIARVVFATSDPKTGACGSLRNVLQDERLNHCCMVRSDVLGRESSDLLKGFFSRLRE
ncbi:MAG: tRNA adenosine(34) deaminase TadA [Candidatus Latescibacterota bacterium]|nr:tRNA adenosine(34) deaminase TadA [Candidatus Latescibacterota bacterium]